MNHHTNAQNNNFNNILNGIYSLVFTHHNCRDWQECVCDLHSISTLIIHAEEGLRSIVDSFSLPKGGKTQL